MSDNLEVGASSREIIKDKLRQNFDGKIVRKDLTKKIKEGANVPVYVLEFLLGQYCSSDDDEVIEQGVQNVKRILADNFVRPDEAQKVLSRLRSRGSHTIIDMVKNYADEYLAALDKGFKKNAMTSGPDEDESVGATADEIIEATRDFILKELSKNLKGYDLEEFVADLLRAMGYHTTVSTHGGDSGIDITAYKDELPPRILVQVKSQDSDIKEATIQSLKGAMREGDYGLFVTLSNYTKNAQKYLDSTPIIRGINGTELVDLILKYYHNLSDKYKKMIPLKMAYIPVPKED